MNLQENIQRIKEMMGIKETIEVPTDSYVTMNIKNFPKFKKEISDLLRDRLQSSNGDFVKFKNSVVVSQDPFVKIPILSPDLKELDNRYLNYMVTMGSKKFNSLLYSIFSDYYGGGTKIKSQPKIAGCDPSNFKILGPLIAQDEKSLVNYWIGQKGGNLILYNFPPF